VPNRLLCAYALIEKPLPQLCDFIEELSHRVVEHILENTFVSRVDELPVNEVSFPPSSELRMRKETHPLTERMQRRIREIGDSDMELERRVIGKISDETRAVEFSVLRMCLTQPEPLERASDDIFWCSELPRGIS
jgi:hypothetical protein